MGDDHWRFSIMSVSRPGDCSIAGPSCSACRAFPRGFAFNAVPEEEKLPATTPPPGGAGPPGCPALSNRERDYCAAPPRADISPSGSWVPCKRHRLFVAHLPTAGCAATRSRAGPPLGGAFWDGGAETFVHKGINGRWRDTLPEDCARYERVAVEQLGEACARWLATGERRDRSAEAYELLALDLQLISPKTSTAPA
jgi:hypothetical protein